MVGNEHDLKGFWGRFARVGILLRWVLVPGWILGAVAAVIFLPGLSSSTGGGLSGIVSTNSPAVLTELGAVRRFGVPLLSRTILVQYEPGGLSPSAQARVITRAARIDAHVLPGLDRIAGAVPILNTDAVFPTAHNPGTTALTYLLFQPSVSSGERQRLVHSLVTRYMSSPGDGYVGSTGTIPATNAEGNKIGGSLRIIELAAIGVVLLVVGMTFRSFGAPIMALLSVGVIYLVTVRVLVVIAKRFGLVLPGELEPLVVLLLVGIVTDYFIFYLSTHRGEYASGRDPVAAAQASGAQVSPIVMVAGVTVAAGTATLQVANLSIYHYLGLGMAITAAIAFISAISFIPPALALVGRFAFWPKGDPRKRIGTPTQPIESPVRTRVARAIAYRPVAALIVVVGVCVLTLAILPIGHLNLGLNLLTDLPSNTTPARAARDVGKGFAPGMLAPTEVVVQHRDIASRPNALRHLQALLSHQPGVAGVLGPGLIPSQVAGAVGRALGARGLHFGLFLAPGGDAARYLVVLARDPFGAQAISTVEHLQSHLGELLDRAGLSKAHGGIAGDTALGAVLTSATRSGIVQIGIAIVAVDLIILIIFLRCLLAPIMLLATSMMSVLAAVGVTTWIFQDLARDNSLTFFVPVAAGVLLVSFGSDYNIFLVGRIWDEAAELSIRHAIVAAVPKASSAITRAGSALALTFGLMAIIPLKSFRSFALAMVVGIILDTFVVRSLLVPCILSLLGRFAAWPNRALMRSLGSSPSRLITTSTGAGR
ncbi:MAG: MMPL family transporter [Acidimicrobiales bacterium]